MTARTLALPLTLLCGVATALSACGNNDAVETTERTVDRAADESLEVMDTMTQDAPVEMLERSYAVVNASGIQIGTLEIEDDEGGGVDIELEVSSLPEGTSAVHFHENGTCDGPDFKSAGGHYNPAGVMHGRLSETGPHAGDMPNIEVPRSGQVDLDFDNSKVTLAARDGYAPLLKPGGTAFIIHAEADDYKSQPSGAAGARIACAVISR